MKENEGTSNPKKYANKVGRLTQDPKLNKPLPYNYYISTYTAIKKETKSSGYMEVVCLILGLMLTS